MPFYPESSAKKKDEKLRGKTIKHRESLLKLFLSSHTNFIERLLFFGGEREAVL